jgi:hypothetical protein
MPPQLNAIAFSHLAEYRIERKTAVLEQSVGKMEKYADSSLYHILIALRSTSIFVSMSVLARSTRLLRREPQRRDGAILHGSEGKTSFLETSVLVFAHETESQGTRTFKLHPFIITKPLPTSLQCDACAVQYARIAFSSCC